MEVGDSVKATTEEVMQTEATLTADPFRPFRTIKSKLAEIFQSTVGYDTYTGG